MALRGRSARRERISRRNICDAIQIHRQLSIRGARGRLCDCIAIQVANRELLAERATRGCHLRRLSFPAAPTYILQWSLLCIDLIDGMVAGPQCQQRAPDDAEYAGKLQSGYPRISSFHLRVGLTRLLETLPSPSCRRKNTHKTMIGMSAVLRSRQRTHAGISTMSESVPWYYS